MTTITQTRPHHDCQLTTLTYPRETQPILYNVPLSATVDIIASVSSLLSENNYHLVQRKTDVIINRTYCTPTIYYVKLVFKVIDKFGSDIFVLVEIHLSPLESIIVDNYTAIPHK